jgi:hypothetical protein
MRIGGGKTACGPDIQRHSGFNGLIWEDLVGGSEESVNFMYPVSI